MTRESHTGVGFPSVQRLLPQSGPMLLLDRVLEHGDDGTRCSVDPSASTLFEEAGRVPVWVSIEYMAQCAGVHGGLSARHRGTAPGPALVAGARRLRFACDGFSLDDALEVEARPAGATARAFAFDCRVLRPGGATSLAEGRLLIARVATDVVAGARTGRL